LIAAPVSVAVGARRSVSRPGAWPANENVAPDSDRYGAAIKAAAEEAKAATAATKNWTPPRTPWGDPDVQGYYFNHSGYTPWSAPLRLQQGVLHGRGSTRRVQEGGRNGRGSRSENGPLRLEEYGMDAWQSGVRPNLRTSLICDPPDGRIPPLTPEAQKRLAAAAAAARARGADVTSPGLYTAALPGTEDRQNSRRG